MALSGSFTTGSYSGRYYEFSWTASQSIANNNSTISWTLTAVGGNSSWYAERTLNVVVAGSTVYSKTDRVERYAGTVTSGSTVISHSDDGTASFSASVEAAVYTSSINCTGSGSFTLDTIARKSTLSVASGTLGTAQTLTVTRKSTSLTHTITYTCGSASGTICTKSSSTSISFTPPLSLASQNTTGTTVSITYTITTYYSSTSVGSNSYTTTCSIPSSVKPSVTLTVAEANTALSSFGSYVQNLSKLSVVLTATTSYGSAISSYKTTVGSNTYTTTAFTTSTLTTSGTITISATVADKRGRTGTASRTITILEYVKPNINNLGIERCKEDGTDSQTGEYGQVYFDCLFYTLNGNNSLSVEVLYKKKSDSAYTSHDTFTYNGSSSTTGTIITSPFPADTGSSYDVKVVATDLFNETTTTASLSTGFAIIHWLASGLGIAFGKLAELTNLLDIGFQTRFSGGILHPTLLAGTDLDDIRTPNTYVGRNTASYDYANCPITSGTFTLEVVGAGDTNQVKQRITNCLKKSPTTYERFYYESAWGGWQVVTPNGVTLYSNTSGSNGTITLSQAASNFSYLEIFFMDNNNNGKGYLKWYVSSNTVWDLFLIEPSSSYSTYFRRTRYNISETTVTPVTTSAGYMRLNYADGYHSDNSTNYIKITRIIGHH